jgi:hypothetical protein
MKKIIINNQKGYAAPLLFLGAFLIIFVTISFIKIGTLDKINPDLSRIGINLGPKATPNNLSKEETSITPTQLTENTEEENILTVASSAIDVDNDTEGEGDNPTYIE